MERRTRAEQQEWIHRQISHGCIIAEFCKPMLYSPVDSGMGTLLRFQRYIDVLNRMSVVWHELGLF